uniref:Uncharacterized protein n=1 Tax=viral metagenome TaxID=1070528 RepID=A0A6H1ZST2_9ZZZZ
MDCIDTLKSIRVLLLTLLNDNDTCRNLTIAEIDQLTQMTCICESLLYDIARIRF